jgi:hypothetical protein
LADVTMGVSINGGLGKSNQLSSPQFLESHINEKSKKKKKAKKQKAMTVCKVDFRIIFDVKYHRHHQRAFLSLLTLLLFHSTYAINHYNYDYSSGK